MTELLNSQEMGLFSDQRAKILEIFHDRQFSYNHCLRFSCQEAFSNLSLVGNCQESIRLQILPNLKC